MNKLISYIIGALAYYTTSTSVNKLIESGDFELFANAPQVIGLVAAVFIVLIYRFLTGLVKFAVCILFPLAFIVLFALENKDSIEVGGKTLGEYMESYIEVDDFDDVIEKAEEAKSVFESIEDTFDGLPKEEKERVAKWVNGMVDGGAEISDALKEKIQPYLDEEA